MPLPLDAGTVARSTDCVLAFCCPLSSVLCRLAFRYPLSGFNSFYDFYDFYGFSPCLRITLSTPGLAALCLLTLCSISYGLCLLTTDFWLLSTRC